MWKDIRVGPNAVNIREIAVLSTPYEFQVWGLEMPVCTYFCGLVGVFPNHDFFFDTLGDFG